MPTIDYIKHTIRSKDKEAAKQIISNEVNGRLSGEESLFTNKQLLMLIKKFPSLLNTEIAIDTDVSDRSIRNALLDIGIGSYQLGVSAVPQESEPSR